MPRKPQIHCCTVPGCTSEWMMASSRILQYCEDHHYMALDLYKEYKMYTNSALNNFNNHDLQMAIKLRTKYEHDFVGEEEGIHKEFIKLLETIASVPFHRRKTLSEKLLEDFNR